MNWFREWWMWILERKLLCLDRQVLINGYLRSHWSVGWGLLMSVCLVLLWSLELDRSFLSVRTPRYTLNLLLFQMGLNNFVFLVDILSKALLRLTISQENYLLPSWDVWRNWGIDRARVFILFFLRRHLDLFLQYVLGFLHVLILNKLLCVFELKVLVLSISFVQLFLHRVEQMNECLSRFLRLCIMLDCHHWLFKSEALNCCGNLK